MDSNTIGINAAIAVTGLSKRTLWRRIAEGVVRKVQGGGGGTPLLLADVLKLARLDFDDADAALLTEADAGSREAQTAIGQRFFLAGRHEAAVYWFERAAAQGDAEAMQCLGQCHAAGTGVPRDDNLALMWIAMAAAHGHGIACRQMAELRATTAL